MRYFYKKFLFIFAIIAVAFSSLFLFSGNKSLEISNCETSAEILNLENQNLTEQNEISAYEDSAKQTYKQDSTHMIYFAVYFLNTLNHSNKDEFQTNYFVAPQTSFDGENYNDQQAKDSSVVCKMSYADKEFYMYNDGVIAHNREYTQENILVTKTAPAPRVDVLTSKNGYKYIGFTYKNEFSKKYGSTTTLKRANNLLQIDGEFTSFVGKDTGFEQNYCTVISLYFYKPANIKMISNDINLGRFSLSKTTTFEQASGSLTLTGLQQGLKLDAVKNCSGSDNTNYVRIFGTQVDIINSKKVSYEREIYVYVLPNQQSYVIDSYNLRNYVLETSFLDEFRYTFTMKIHNIFFDILSNIQDSSSASLKISYGGFSTEVSLENGKNIQTDVVMTNIPENYSNSLYGIITSKDSSKKFILSTTPLSSFEEDYEKSRTCTFSDVFSLTDDLDFKKIMLYVYEIFDINIDYRTTNITPIKNLYKIYGTDFDLNLISKNLDLDGFSLYGFSLNENDLDLASLITKDAKTTIFANWKKTISASLISKGQFEPVEKIYKKEIFNFSNDDFIEISNSDLPLLSNSFFAFSTSENEILKSDDFEQNKILRAGQTLYAFYKYNLSLNYDTSSDKDVKFEPVPKNYNETVFKNYNYTYGGENIKISETQVSKQHFDFLGWQTFVGSSLDYYQSGDKIWVEYDKPVTLYPNFKDHFYTLSINLNGGEYSGKDNFINPETGLLEIKMVSTDRFYFNKFTKFGYEVASVQAKNHPENIEYGCYDGISEDDYLEVTWKEIKYNVRLSTQALCPNGETNIEINLNYTYFDKILNKTITESLIIKRRKNVFVYDDIYFSFPANSKVHFTASIDMDNYNLSFQTRSDIRNKTCDYEFDFDSPENDHIIIFLTRTYLIDLVYEENNKIKTSTILKYHQIDLYLPKNLGKKDGYEQLNWNESEDLSSLNIYKIKAELNEDKTLYAVFSMYARFYVESLEAPEYSQTCVPNQKYGYSGAKMEIIKNGITYRFCGYSTDPNSTKIVTNGTNLTFEKSICFYAVWQTTELSKIINSTVTLNFHTKTDIVPINVSRTITYSNYKVLTNITFSVFDESDYVNGEKEYQNEKVKFIEGIFTNSNNKKFLIYGWNNTGKFSDKYFTSEDDILVKENLDFYAIFREDIKFDIGLIYHNFYFRGKLPVTRYTNSYTRSNTFYISDYNFTSSLQISDGKEYETTYDNLTFDNLLAYQPRHENQTFVGWGKLSRSTTIAWSSETPEIEVRGDTNWYGIFKYTYDEIKTETIRHKFIASNELSYEFETIKTVAYVGAYDYISCSNQVKIFDGTPSAPKFSSFNFYDTPQFYIDNLKFIGWSTDKNSFDIVLSSEKTSFSPEKSTTFYPVFSTNISFAIYAKYEDISTILVSESITSKVNYDFSKFQYEKFSLTIPDFLYADKEKFIGWMDTDNPDEIFKTDSKYTFTNIKKDNDITLFAVFKEVPTYEIKIVSNDKNVIYNISAGEYFELASPEQIEGKMFKYYSCNGEKYNVGDKIYFNSDSEIIAVYSDGYDENQENIKDNKNDSKNLQSKNNITIIIIIISSVILISAITIFILFKFTNIFKKRKTK